MISQPILLATYRLQFTPEFRFDDARRQVAYFRELGITHVYSSPVLKPRRGSSHGYDVVDPDRINLELGGESALVHFANELHARELGLILDVVPNHMAAVSENPYWDHVLAYGLHSRYARWFDIDFRQPDPELWGRVLIPVLGDRLERVIERGELAIAWDGTAFRVHYFEQSFPLNPATLPPLLAFVIANQTASSADTKPLLRELRGIMRALRALPRPTGRIRKAQPWPHPEACAALENLAAFVNRSPATREWTEASARAFGEGEAGQARLRRLLDAQCYRLAFWRRAARILNYRRFFDINDLVAVRQEDPEVFRETHATILRLVSQGLIDGLRIDHVDGLRDPRGYLARLAAAVEVPTHADQSRPFPIYVEKILAPTEPLPESWPVAGTTGYEFLNQVESMLLSPEGASEIGEGYQRMLRRRVDFKDIVYRAKRRVLRAELAPFARLLARILFRLAHLNPAHGALTHADLFSAIVETVACLPVYRTYIENRDIAPHDRQYIEIALAGARWRQRANPHALDFLGEVLLLKDLDCLPDNEKQERISFIQRFQQLSGPAAAKGTEDTALYVYTPLASRNEVGGEPDAPLESAVADLHRGNHSRSTAWPGTLLGVTTHDTKRAADVRARLDVLSELPKLWAAHLERWRRWNRPRRRRARGRLIPEAGTEYLLYQTIVGIWPAPHPERPDETAPGQAAVSDLRDRVEAYLLKAVREMKIHTSWIDPDPQYEDAVLGFTRDLFLPGSDGGVSEFLRDVNRFVSRIARAGFWNSLARTLIQFTAPGVPDIYQGDELWNFVLVDPDNRRPVDYELRHRLLKSILDAERSPVLERVEFLRGLVAAPEDGRIKLHVVRSALHAQRAFPQLFKAGRYIPLEADGPAARHIFAFARANDTAAAVAIVTRLAATLSADPARTLADESAWADTVIRLPENLRHRSWRLELSGETLADASEAFRAADALAACPVALLIADAPADS